MVASKVALKEAWMAERTGFCWDMQSEAPKEMQMGQLWVVDLESMKVGGKEYW
jgi:hypothetical protein